MIKIEHNVETGQIKEIQLSAADIKKFEKEYAEQKAKNDIEKIESEAKAQAKVAAEGKLAALGLTTDDLRALGL
jgi:regulator of protease activity HflC (stomatin/prohibitin superfamily)